MRGFLLQGRHIPVQGRDTRRHGHRSGSSYAAVPAHVLDYYNLIFFSIVSFVAWSRLPGQNTNVVAALHLGTNRAQSVMQFNFPDALEVKIVCVCCQTLPSLLARVAEVFHIQRENIWVFFFFFQPSNVSNAAEPVFLLLKKESALFLPFSSCTLFFSHLFNCCRGSKR